MASLKEILSTIDMVLGVVKTAAETPGVNMLPYASTVSSAVSAIRVAVDAGKNVAPYIEALKNTFSGGVPTQEQLDALDAVVDDLHAKVQKPLPPREEGEDE